MNSKLPTPRLSMRKRIAKKLCAKLSRRGSATVELAVTLPFLITLVFGVIELGRALEVIHTLTIASREGARFGATDKQGFIPSGMTANEKIVQDVHNVLVAAGMPTSGLSVQCLTVAESPGDSQTDFDFEDPDNHLKEFEVVASIPFSEITYCPPPLQKFFNPTELLEGRATFRNYHK
jgi:hypothetical protein